MKTTKTSKAAVATGQQNLFNVIVLASFLLITAIQFQMATEQQLTLGTDALYVSYLMLGMAPVLYFGVAYLLSTHQKLSSQRTFMSLLVAFAGTMIASSLTAVVSTFPVSTHTSLEIGFAINGAVLILVSLYLWALRRGGRW